MTASFQILPIHHTPVIMWHDHTMEMAAVLKFKGSRQASPVFI